jgi:hypothetical protein
LALVTPVNGDFPQHAIFYGVPVMQLVKTVFRPVYRLFVERPLWWFLARVKAFFLAEIDLHIQQTERRLADMEERARKAEENNAAQWDAIEQLLLAMFRQPGRNADRPTQANEASAVNERNNLR